MIAQKEITINNDTVYLIETLKVEGYWSRKSFTLTLQNKDIPLLNHIEEIIKKLGFGISKRLLLKIRLKDNTKKEEVNLLWRNKKLNFHIEKSPFDSNKVKAVTSLPYGKNYRIRIMYQNKEYTIQIRALKDKIKYKSEMECWIYGDLRFPSKKLLDFLDYHCGGNKNLQIEDVLFKSKPGMVMSVFSALVDCEGTINWYSLKREIQIRMRDRGYLKQWSELLSKFDVGNKFRKHDDNWEIIISGWEDFDRLEKLGFRLYHSKKSDKWKKMMNGFKRNQISRGSYKEYYIKKLRELNKKITAKELASYLNKSKRVANHYLLKLEKERLIHCDRGTWPYLYFIST